MATMLAAALTAVLGTPMVIALTRWAQHDPQQLPRVERVGVLIVLAAALAAAAAVLAERHGPGAVLVTAPLLVLGAAASLVDVLECRLPNVLTGPLLLLGAIAVIAAAIYAHDPGIAARALVASALATAMMTLARLVRPSAVGWGDIKLAAGLGWFLGWPGWHAVYTGLFSWWILIGALAALGLATGVVRRADPLPYGPAMVLGTVLALSA